MRAQWGLLGATAVGLVFFTFGLVAEMFLVIRASQRMRLIRDGQAAIGTVSSVRPNDSALKVTGTFRVHYQFTDHAGTTRHGQGPAQHWSLAGRWKPGDAVLVLYDPNFPSRNEADLFEARSKELDELQDLADAQ